jgi:dihydrofolate synthase / folylpolyglutamate synthase
MHATLTYDQAIAVLDATITSGIKLGLDNTYKLLAAMGNPHQGLKVIHVAGTNGKGSVCALLAGALTAAGLRTGLYTSPHLVCVRERVRLDGRSISEADFCHEVTLLDTAIRQLQEADPAYRPTYFEFMTALAFLYYRRLAVDVVILEVGLGGRLDSTNVVTPVISVITTIDFDHQRTLGSTLWAIAGEKGGIIKPGVPVLVAEEKEEPRLRLADLAEERQSPVLQGGVDFAGVSCRLAQTEPPWRQENIVRFRDATFTLNTRLVGPHQLQNTATAWATLCWLRELGWDLNLERLAEGFAGAPWPARLQLLPDGLILDGAHNPSGLEVTLRCLAELYPERQWPVVFAVMKDKPWTTMLERLAPLTSHLYLVPVENERAEDPKQIVSYLRGRHRRLPVTICATVAEGLAALRAQAPALVLGSLYLAGEVLAEYTAGQPVDLVE